MAPSSFRQVTLQLEVDFHERGIHIGADGSVLCSRGRRMQVIETLGRRMQVHEKVFVVHPGDAWGIIATITEYQCLMDVLGVHVIVVQAVGMFGAAYALRFSG